MAERPWFKFWGSVWLSDPQVIRLSLEARGLLVELMAMAHGNSRRGFLGAEGDVWGPNDVASVRNIDKRRTKRAWNELELRQRIVMGEDGIWFIPRMVRDEGIAIEMARRGSMGGSPVLKQQLKQQLKLEVKPEGEGEESRRRPPSPQGGHGRGRGLTEAQKARRRVSENTPRMIEVGGWFNRSPKTLWSLKEAEALEQVDPQAEELQLMGRYYTASIEKDDNIRRRDVVTLLNNWTGECDRAREFAKKARGGNGLSARSLRG